MTFRVWPQVVTFIALFVFLCRHALALPALKQPEEGPSKSRLLPANSSFNLDHTLGHFFNFDLGDFTRSTESVASCYSDQLKDVQLNIFNSSLTAGQVARHYYSAFPEKVITDESIGNLLNSTQDIISQCLQPNRQSQAKFGFTWFSDWSPSEFDALASSHIESPLNHRIGRRAFGHRCDATEMVVPESFDWRDRGVVTSVKSQQNCGSCWVFAVVASTESALLIRNQTGHTAQTMDLAEQALLDCSGRHCNGGNADIGFSYIQRAGIPEEATLPYRARRNWLNRCSKAGNSSTDPPIYRIADYCVDGFIFARLPDKRIQQSLLKFGPLYITMSASFRIQNYKGSVIDSRHLCPVNGPNNHAVLLVGWTKEAWILRNSWSKYWGDNGYFQIKKGTPLQPCGINRRIAWALVD